MKPETSSSSLGNNFLTRKSTNFNKDDSSIFTRKLAGKFETWKSDMKITKPLQNYWREQADLKSCEIQEPIRSSQAVSGDAGQQQESWLARGDARENFRDQ